MHVIAKGLGAAGRKLHPVPPPQEEGGEESVSSTRRRRNITPSTTDSEISSGRIVLHKLSDFTFNPGSVEAEPRCGCFHEQRLI